MSRRRPPADEPGKAPERRPRAKRSSIGVDLLLMFGAFVLASALAGALGATNLGTALSFGQIAFALAAVYVMLRR